MLSKRTVVFDLGGVLIDWNPRYLYREIFADEVKMEFFLNQICTPAWNAQMDLDKSFKDAADELIMSYPEYTSQIQIWYDRWEEMIGGPITGTVEILKEIKQSGYPLAALSNWSAETFPIAYKKYDFLSWFTPVIISGEVGLVKPDPKIFQFHERFHAMNITVHAKRFYHFKPGGRIVNVELCFVGRPIK